MYYIEKVNISYWENGVERRLFPIRRIDALDTAERACQYGGKTSSIRRIGKSGLFYKVSDTSTPTCNGFPFWMKGLPKDSK